MNQKEYLTSLGRILKDKKTKYPVKDKLAELIQSWGVGLQSSARFPNFFMTYQALRHAGVHFNPSVADYSEPPAPVVHRSASPQTLYANIFSSLLAQKHSLFFILPFFLLILIRYRQSTVPRPVSSQGAVYVDQYGNRVRVRPASGTRSIPAAPRSSPAATYPVVTPASTAPSESRSVRASRIRSQLETMKTKAQLLEDVLCCVDPGDVESNEIIAELLPSCRVYREDVLRWIEEGNLAEELLGELLSLNDQLGIISDRHEALLRLARDPDPSLTAAHQSSLASHSSRPPRHHPHPQQPHHPSAVPSLLPALDSDDDSQSPFCPPAGNSRPHRGSFHSSDGESEDSLAFSLPPPPGQRTPPLIRDTFLARPLMGSSASLLPPPASLEEFLLTPPRNPASVTSTSAMISQLASIDLSSPSTAAA
ncbi:MAG: VHS and GAT domain-containing protein, partial [archaeon]|nr:VHS and GAT domain-containing protein [archaeon]